MTWFRLIDTFGVLLLVPVLCIGVLTLLVCLKYLAGKNYKGLSICFPVHLFILLLSIFLIKNTSTTWTEEQRVVIDKAAEQYDAMTIYFTIEEQKSLSYPITIRNEQYIFVLNKHGMNVEQIYHAGDLVYESSEENIDEYLSDHKKSATAKVRELTGNESAFIQESINSGYLVKSEGKLYTVKFDWKNSEIEYVLHNDKYIYEREG